MPLAGETLFLVGRIQGLTRRRLDTLVRLREGKLATRPGRTVTLIAFGHSAVDRALDDGRVALPPGLPAAAALISENVLRRALGLLAPPEEVDRSMGRGEIERLAGLSPNLVSCLVLFDVLEPVGPNVDVALRLARPGGGARGGAPPEARRGDRRRAAGLDRAAPARRHPGRGAAGRRALGRAAARGRRPARRALGPAHDVRQTRPAEAAQHRRSSGRGRGSRGRGRPRHGREPLHHGDARRCRRSRAALQPRQRLPGAGPRGGGQGGVADRGGARSGLRRGLVQSGARGRGRAADAILPSPSTGAP